MNSIVEKARLAKRLGYEYAASVVRSKYRTTWYHVVRLDDIIEAGKWIPAPIGEWPTADGQGYWYGRLGQRELPQSTILRQEMLNL